MSDVVAANIGSWIGRGLANGEPLAILAAIMVPVAFAVAYRVAIWWNTN